MDNNKKRFWFIITTAFIIGLVIIIDTEFGLDFPHRDKEAIGQSNLIDGTSYRFDKEGIAALKTLWEAEKAAQSYKTYSDSTISIDLLNNVHVNYPGITVYIECENVNVVWDTLRSEEK